MKPMEEYWQRAAADWDASSYGQTARGSSVERVATLLRAHIRKRYETAERSLAPWIEGRRFLEIGCGGGELAVRLVELGAASGVAVDVSPDVVEVARRRADDAGVGERLRFETSTIAGLTDVPDVDLAVGLGILEYLEPTELCNLIQRVRPRDVFFSFDESRPSLLGSMHVVYRRLKRFPYYKKYRATEIVSLLAESGISGTRVVREGGNAFVTTLPA